MHAFKLPWLSLKKYSFSTSWLKFELSNCIATATATAKSLQSCPTLCDPVDSRPPASPVSGILQARTLDWVAISFSNTGKWKVKGKSLSRIQLLETPRTAAYQAPLFIGFSRQEYWSGVPLPSPKPVLRLWEMHFFFLNPFFPLLNLCAPLPSALIQKRKKEIKALVNDFTLDSKRSLVPSGMTYFTLFTFTNHFSI